MEQQPEPTDPSEEIASPTEAMKYLTEAFRAPNIDWRHKVMAAQGIINYHLASEIAGLIGLLTRVDKLPPIEPEDMHLDELGDTR